MKRRERKGIPPIGKPLSFLLDALVGYGREPQRAIYVSIAIALLGSWIFRRRDDVVSKRPHEAATVYNPFWYSLDLLAPVINLDAADVWTPRPDWRFGRNYARLQRILGWILAPIIVAAITGIMK